MRGFLCAWIILRMSITAPDDRISEYNPVVATTDFPALFPVFDNDDIAVFVDGVERDDFAVTATYVEGISSNAKAVFAIGITGSVKVVGARGPHRTNRFGSGPLPPRDLNLAFDTLEAEVQEASRDIGRALKVNYGQPPLTITEALTDGHVLMRSGDRIVNGPDGQAIIDAAENAEEAEDAAAAAIAAAASVSILRAANLAALKAINTTTSKLAFLAGRSDYEFVAGDFATLVALDTTQSVFIASNTVSASAGAWVLRVYLNGEILNVKWFGAPLDGIADDGPAFAAAAKLAAAQVSYVSFYAAMPNAPVGTVRVPHGTVKLTANVDTSGKMINWLLDSGVKFAGDCAGYLGGRLVRPERINLRRPHGRLDSATGFSVQVGDGFFGHAGLGVGDVPAQTSGWISVADASVYLDNGVVGLQANVSGSPIIVALAATYTAGGASWATAIDPTEVYVGMEVRTLHGTGWRSIIESIAADGKSLTVSAWYLLGDMTKTPGTPPSPANLVINPMDKAWALNLNSFITPPHFTYQTAVIEGGLYNSKVLPANAEDGNGRTWGADFVNLGPNKGSMAFVARGSFYEGYRATGVDIGFRAAAYSALGYSTPSVGFEYAGDGAGFRQHDSANRTVFSVGLAGLEIGRQGVSQTTIIDFHSSATVNDYDARIAVTGGGGSSAAGTMTMIAGTMQWAGGPLQPETDAVLNLGAASKRVNNSYFAVSPTVTSDPSLKRFADMVEKTDEWAALRRVMMRLRSSITLYQWVDAIKIKGDDARWHIGLNAEQVRDICIDEGLNAARYAFFCEDDLYENIRVIDRLPVQELEEVEQEVTEQDEEDDRIVVRKVKKLVKVPKVVTKPFFDEAGEPIYVEQAMETEDGRIIGRLNEKGEIVPILKRVQAEAKIPVMTYKEVPRLESRPVLNADGTPVRRLGLRYELILLAMLATS